MKNKSELLAFDLISELKDALADNVKLIEHLVEIVLMNERNIQWLKNITESSLPENIGISGFEYRNFE